MRQFLEVESAHYPGLEVLISGEMPVSRIELFKLGKKVDMIPIYRWNIDEVRVLMHDLGLKRDEALTWEKRGKEEQLASAFNRPRKDEL